MSADSGDGSGSQEPENGTVDLQEGKLVEWDATKKAWVEFNPHTPVYTLNEDEPAKAVPLILLGDEWKRIGPIRPPDRFRD